MPGAGVINYPLVWLRNIYWVNSLPIGPIWLHRRRKVKCSWFNCIIALLRNVIFIEAMLCSNKKHDFQQKGILLHGGKKVNDYKYLDHEWLARNLKFSTFPKRRGGSPAGLKLENTAILFLTLYSFHRTRQQLRDVLVLGLHLSHIYGLSSSII